MLWIGGAAGAGKTTIARLLARRHGLRRYSPDTWTWKHADRALTLGDPAARRFARMTPAERAAAAPEEIDFDRAPMIVDDLRSLPDDPLVVAELEPPYPEIASPGQAVFLLPSREARHTRLEQRHPGGVPQRYLHDQPAPAAELTDRGTQVIVVDDHAVADTLAEVEQFFAHRIAEGPTAVSIVQRRDLLREANQAVVTQYLTWADHTPGIDGSKRVRDFDCECADSACTEVVRLQLSTASQAVATPAPSILATGH